MPILEQDSQDDMYNPETVTLTRNDSSDTISITDATRYPISSKEMMRSHGFYLKTDEIWTFSFDSVGSWKPKPGWVIIDADSNRNIIVDVTPSKILQFWRCFTRDLAIVHQLNNEIAVWRPTEIKDNAGRVTNTSHTLIVEDLKARIQPMDKQTGQVIGVLRLNAPFVIPIEYDPGIRVNDQIRIDDGRIFEVLSVMSPDELAALPYVECVYNGATWNG